MAYAMFRCCVTANHLPEIDVSTDVLLSRLGIETVEDIGFGCCGYPLKNVDMTASLAASARNLALAEREGKPILTTCACCYGTLQHAARLLKDDTLRAKANESLAPEGLSYGGRAVVRHLLHVLKDDVELDRIASEARAAHAYRNVVVQYGCKLLRPNLPSELVSPGSEPFFERLVAAAGSTVIPWGLEKDCCGSGIRTTDRALADSINQVKMLAAQRVTADAVVTVCPFCMLQLRRAAPDEHGIAVLSVSQLLYLALGLEGGIVQNQLGVENTVADARQPLGFNVRPC